ncbi:RDD family protein [Thalassotalea sp. ND16A]|uniref:RDD family protein n=1 Tax=Thalassotalea sp. ND16A TaxID=1535422 RepID=UPI000519FDA9|nr:RDD family protein [Thalassotalea sp. ND16A]KGJ93507.1 hypothetical protein ND16A_1482 [Thalassotalea sp. ND16A]
MEEIQEEWICGFWRRVGALFIDSLILGAVGFTLGLFLENTFVQLGGWGRLIGFAISITYFGFMNSSIFNGQTFGKKILGIKVVDSTNSTIRLSKSLLRYSFLAIPFSLNGAQFTNEALLSYLMYPLSLIVFGGLFSISYLYIFNRVTRQSLHDLIVGTYVVNSDVSEQNLGEVWRPHLIVISCLFILAGLLPVFTSDLAQSEPFKGLLSSQEAISSNTSVKFASVVEGATTFTSSNTGSSTTTYVNTQAFLYQNSVDDIELAQQLAQTIISSYPESINKNVIQVTLTYGYDIGIWSQWNSYNHAFNPNEIQGLDKP